MLAIQWGVWGSIVTALTKIAGVHGYGIAHILQSRTVVNIYDFRITIHSWCHHFRNYAYIIQIDEIDNETMPLYVKMKSTILKNLYNKDGW